MLRHLYYNTMKLNGAALGAMKPKKSWRTVEKAFREKYGAALFEILGDGVLVDETGMTITITIGKVRRFPDAN